MTSKTPSGKNDAWPTHAWPARSKKEFRPSPEGFKSGTNPDTAKPGFGYCRSLGIGTAPASSQCEALAACNEGANA
jgi:hypothetical protein